MGIESNTFDASRVLQTAGLVAASAAGTNIEDLGPGIGVRYGKVVIDVTALEIASNDEAYTIHVQGSPDAAFGTAGNIVELASLHLGAKETKLSDCDRDDSTGRRELLFVNKNEAGTALRYLRLYITVAGTIATGINFSARFVPLKQMA
jgi:hypothetical protein